VQVDASGRGLLIPRQATNFGQVFDGLSNTILAAEISSDLGDQGKQTSASLANPWDRIHDRPVLCQDQIDPERPNFWQSSATKKQEGTSPRLSGGDQGRGMRWADGAALYTGVNTILPPNREVCLAGGDSGIGMLPPSSRHQGGVHVLMGDGAVKFVTDSIEAGDSSAGTVIRDGEGARRPGAQSPFGLWGALGTAANAEKLRKSFNCLASHEKSLS
jgi:prepilin-type processing-associated H-X9-DG protein